MSKNKETFHASRKLFNIDRESKKYYSKLTTEPNSTSGLSQYIQVKVRKADNKLKGSPSSVFVPI